MGHIEFDHDQGISIHDYFFSNLCCPRVDFGFLACLSSDNLTQMHLLIQAQALIQKNAIYEKIRKEVCGLAFFQPNIYNILPHQCIDYGETDENGQELPMLSFHRDLAISNLRFLAIFYASGPSAFALATNLLDRLLSRTKVALKSLPIIATCCFYLGTIYSNNFSIPIDPVDLMKLTQCETTREVFCEIANFIHNETWLSQRPVTPFSLIMLFYDVLALQDPLLHDIRLKVFAVARLEVILCHFEFTKFMSDIVALAFLNHFVQKIGCLSDEKLHTIVELQYYCQMDLLEYKECFALVEQYMSQYDNQPTKQPRLKLSWTISRRVLLKRKPSLLVKSNLEAIVEEELNSSENTWCETCTDKLDQRLNLQEGKASVDNGRSSQSQRVSGVMEKNDILETGPFVQSDDNNNHVI